MIQKSSIVEQAASYMRERILKGQWSGVLQGRDRLAIEMGVSHMTVQRAVERLEKEGLLLNQGNGRRRKIVASESWGKQQYLRVAILRHEPDDTKIHFVVDYVHKLREAGHDVVYADKTQAGLKMNVKRVARFVEKTEADAWIVHSGSFELLEWFASQPKPSFALFGRMSPLPIAGGGPVKLEACAAAIQHLVKLGHSRIVSLATRPGQNSLMKDLFSKELAACGIPVSEYNLPDIGESAEDLEHLLSSLFLSTPPTAIITGTVDLLLAVQAFLLHRGIAVPRDVSLGYSDPEPNFRLCRPTIAHIQLGQHSVCPTHRSLGEQHCHGEKRRRPDTDPGDICRWGNGGAGFEETLRLWVPQRGVTRIGGSLDRVLESRPSPN